MGQDRFEDVRIPPPFEHTPQILPSRACAVEFGAGYGVAEGRFGFGAFDHGGVVGGDDGVGLGDFGGGEDVADDEVAVEVE